MKSFFSPWMACLLALALLSCEGGREETLEYSISVDPPVLNLIQYQRAEISAEVVGPNGKARPDFLIRWNSEDPDIATVDGNGVVSGISEGETLVEAEAGGKKTLVAVQVREPVLESVEIEPREAKLIEGQEIQLSARILDETGRSYFGLPVTWTSSDPEVVEVSEDGRVLARLRNQTATVTLTLGDWVAVATIEVLAPVTWVDISPSILSVLEGKSARISATPKDLLFEPLEGRAVFWETRDPSIASVDENGILTGHGVGETEIRGIVEGKTGWGMARVLPRAASLELELEFPKIRVGGQAAIRGVARSARSELLAEVPLSWSSSRPEVAQIVGGSRVDGIGEGATILRAWNEEHGVEGEVSLIVGPKGELVVPGMDRDLLEAGETFQLHVSFRENDGSIVPAVDPLWSSWDEGIATVDANGRVAVVGLGRATITVRVEGLSMSLDALAAVRFVDMALGSTATCGLTRNGSVWCWGKKKVAMKRGFYDLPTAIPEKTAAGLVAIRSDESFCMYYPEVLDEVCDLMLGLTVEGEVVAWTFGLPARKIPFSHAFVDFSSNGQICGVTASGGVFCGDQFLDWTSVWKVLDVPGGFCVLDLEGGVSCRERGATGLDLTGFQFAPLGEHETIFPVSLSANHGCGLTLDGDAVCWGENRMGQVESPANEGTWIPPKVVATNVRSLAVDRDVSFFVGSDGRLSVRGGAEMPMLVSCSLGMSYEPNANRRISIDDRVEGFHRQGEIASVHTGSGDHRCLLVGNGRPYCWGVTSNDKVGMHQIMCLDEATESHLISGPVGLPVSIYPEF